MKKARKTKHQAMVEYIIIVAIIAIGCLTVFGLFGDTIVEKVSGVINSLGGSHGGDAVSEADGSSKARMVEMGSGGLE